MEINLLVLNVGNSRLAVGVFVGGELEYVRRVGEEEGWNGEGRIGGGVSVVPAVMEPLEHVVSKVTKKKVEWVGREIDLPIKVATERPEETGVDRVVNVAAAYEQMGKACVVVDAGTAITVNVCDDKGEF